MTLSWTWADASNTAQAQCMPRQSCLVFCTGSKSLCKLLHALWQCLQKGHDGIQLSSGSWVSPLVLCQVQPDMKLTIFQLERIACSIWIGMLQKLSEPPLCPSGPMAIAFALPCLRKRQISTAPLSMSHNGSSSCHQGPRLAGLRTIQLYCLLRYEPDDSQAASSSQVRSCAANTPDMLP